MKKLVSAAIVCASIILVLCNANPTHAEDFHYLGDFYLSCHKTQDEHGPTDATYVAKISITYIGGVNFLVQGIVEVQNDNPFVMGGTARLVGDDILMTMSGSQEHSSGPSRDTATIHVKLDAKTLSGTYFSNSLDFNTRTNEFYHCYASGTATLTTSP